VHCGPSGAELAARRTAAGLTQNQLAQLAGLGRSTVQYWERAPRLDPHGWAVDRLAGVLGWSVHAYNGCSTARACESGDCPYLSAAAEGRASGTFLKSQVREAQRVSVRRVICGAKTRKNTNCGNKSEPGKTRCKFHGGMSTGARTPEGIERIREAQRRRWARVRGESVACSLRVQLLDPAVNHELEGRNHACT